MENQHLSTGECSRLAGEDEQNDEVAEVANLEEEVKQMAEKLNKYRSTLSDQFKSTLTSILISQRPVIRIPDCERGSEPGTSEGLHQASSSGNSSQASGHENDEKGPDEVELLRDKISSNISAMPNVLKRMNKCISRIDKLNSSGETIHPAFKRKKSSHTTLS